jgi:hypothetical protein
MVLIPEQCHPRRSGAKRNEERGSYWRYVPKPREVPDLHFATLRLSGMRANESE